MSQNRGCLIGTLLVVVLVVVLFAGLDLYTDLVWLDTLGVASVLWRRLFAENLLFIAAWVVATLFLAANWWLARLVVGGGQMAVPWLEGQRTRTGYTTEPTARVVAARVANGLLAAMAVVVGLFFALPARSMWLRALMSIHATSFGEVDPILGRDLSFYVFRLPWLQFLQGWFLWLLFVALAGAALVYLASFSAERFASRIQVVGEGREWLRLTPAAQRHLLVLGAVALGLFAWGYQLNIPSLLYSTTGAAFGAGYADVHARLPVMHLLTAIVALGAGILIASMFVRVRWLPYAAVGAWLLIAFVGGSIYPSVLQRLVVVPNEPVREREYINNTIDMTRAAYGLADVIEYDFEAAEEAVPVDLVANEGTIMNIRLWDYRPLLRTYAQLQEIRLYYAFTDVDIDRYHVDGDYRQVTLSVREISYDKLPAPAQTWVNRHLVYTHGYGVVLGPVNEVREEGLPVLWVRDIPPRSQFPELELSRPEIYFGELTEEYVVVQTEEQELDYPAGDQNVYTTYEGTGGVVLDSALKRLAYSLRLGSSQILLTGSITEESRLLWRRVIRERVEAVAPFLAYDPDPYPVIINGRLVWLLDAYTSSDAYPYSEPISTSYGRLNYIRNSVKVTIDAYDGSLGFYLIDPSDPVATTYATIFPDLFQPVEEMDPQLIAHWRYPEGLFRIQAAKFQTFHMTDPQVFYNQEDLWSWPQELARGEQMLVEPYYVNMRLPGRMETEFVLMLPYTPSARQNMVAWLYARNDGENYGEMGVFEFSKQRLIYGPMQVESRIDQDPVISQQLSLWNQRGSQVIRGNLLVIPLDVSILYVEPIYLQAEASSLPELRRVIVAYGSQIAMEETLAAGLARVMGAAPVGEEPAGPKPSAPVLEGEVADLILQADTHYQAAQACLQDGDWACYGREIDALEEVLEALVNTVEEPME